MTGKVFSIKFVVKKALNKGKIKIKKKKLNWEN